MKYCKLGKCCPARLFSLPIVNLMILELELALQEVRLILGFDVSRGQSKS